jgi:hypothetical protein
VELSTAQLLNDIPTHGNSMIRQLHQVINTRYDDDTDYSCDSSVRKSSVAASKSVENARTPQPQTGQPHSLMSVRLINEANY